MKVYYLIILIAISVTSFSRNDTLEVFFNNNPEISFEEIESDKKTTYELKIKQPLDHTDSSKGYFYQRVILTHYSFIKPVVLAIEGYAIYAPHQYELVTLLLGNQINVEHRFFGQSLPDSLNYKYLTLAQASADLHHIHELFKDLYNKDWISTGISKGGTSSLFYKYYYPDDVSACVAYVAPLAQGVEDQRVYHFLDTVGSSLCRNKIFDYQLSLLRNSKKILPVLKKLYINKGYSFNYLSIEEAFEYSVLEFSFAFWQYGKSCNHIPVDYKNMQKSIEYYLSTNPLFLFSDQGIEYYSSHYYQAGTEMGYYGYNINPLKKHIKFISTNKNPSAIFSPKKIKLSYNQQITNDFKSWLENEGNNIIYLYGKVDTWSACAIYPSKNVNSIVFFLDNKHHGNTNVSEMTICQREDFMKYLYSWIKG